MQIIQKWFITSVFLMTTATFGADTSQPAKPPLMTRWASSVTPDSVLPEYPRPQLVRSAWKNLNGPWDYAIRPKGDPATDQYDGKILVPFPVESVLSGVTKRVGDRNNLIYSRTFDVPPAWAGKHVLLHFGAVDWQATVYLNGKLLTVHQGGYTHFTIDITDSIRANGPQELIVSDWDPTETGDQPRGKQISSPRGIWYSPVTGIWQTVWLEPVSACSVESLRITTDVDLGQVTIRPTLRGNADGVVLTASIDGKNVATANANQPLQFTVASPKLWSPDSPNLYDAKITASRNGMPIDDVSTYFGIRKVSLARDSRDALRLFLNNHPLFQFGPLDQGWWPDGLYTAPTDDALKSDLELDKSLGFNMTRKHVKVEPDRWYYWCDKMGLIVWQDMPSGFREPRTSAPATRSAESAREFESELKDVMDELQAHPCITQWVIFNESWGQYDTKRLTDWAKQYDPTRLIDNPSGWTDQKVGDMHDLHHYPDPASYSPESDRAVVLGEFGGLNLSEAGHLWKEQGTFGYRKLNTGTEVTDSIIKMVGQLHDLSGASDLSAAVYTQLSDVELEINGLTTYDRAVVKVDVGRIAPEIKKLLTEPPPRVTVLLPVARDHSAVWMYSTTKPADDWANVKFNPVGWRYGAGAFGIRTDSLPIRTIWDTQDVWLRTDFTIDAQVRNPYLRLNHVGDAEVYLNGKLIKKVSGRGTRYEDFGIEAREAFMQGRNIIAIHCHRNKDGQLIDAGLIDLVPSKD